MGKIIAFKDLEEKSRNEILRASMTADFDSRLSFGLVNENNTLLGYSLLKPESIDSSIEIKATFDSSQYACRVIGIREIGNNNSYIFAELCKKTIDRVQIWNFIHNAKTF